MVHIFIVALIVGGLTGVAIGAWKVFAQPNRIRNERQRALTHMQGRPSLKPAEFGHRYFPPAQADIAAQVRAIFAKYISVDVSQAHPDDKFNEELRMDSLDSMSTIEFAIELEKHFEILISDSEAEQMQTLRDITEFISRKLQI